MRGLGGRPNISQPAVAPTEPRALRSIFVVIIVNIILIVIVNIIFNIIVNIIVKIIVNIILTRPKPVYGRQGLAGQSLRASSAQLGSGK